MPSETVALWKNSWLPFSETFIRDQIQAMSSWHATTLGFHNLKDSIFTADCAPYDASRRGITTRRLLGVSGKKDIYVRHLRRTNASVMHAHFGSGGIYSLPLAVDVGIPHITTFHGADTHQFGSRVPGTNYWYKRALSDVFRSGDQLVAASSFLADRLIDSGAPREKIEVLYTGTTPTPLQSVDKRSGIAFLGRLIEIKGAEHLLRAVATFKTPHARKTTVSIAGDGPLRGQLEQLAKNMGIHCNFVGRISSDEVPGFLARHEVFCAPSIPSATGTREGFGMVFLEAALQQLPVVAYASGGVKESVSHGSTGLLAPEGDIELLGRYLESMIIDKKMAESMGNQGRKRVLESFNVLNQAAKLESIYSSLAG